MCLLAAVCYAYDFLLRVEPNIVVSETMHIFTTNAAGVGFLYAAYYWAYTPLQIPVGIIVDRFNPKMVLASSTLLCAAGAMLFAHTHNYSLAIVSRLLMGLGSAFAFICALKLAAVWLPRKHFAAFSGLATTLGTVGALTTNAVLPIWLKNIGFSKTIALTGVIGLSLGILVAIFIKSKPKQTTSTVPHEFRTLPHALDRIVFIAKQHQIWINGMVGCLLFLPISVLANLWGTQFLSAYHHLSSQSAALADAMIYVGMAMGAPAAGWCSDKMQKRKKPMLISAIILTCLLFIFLYAPYQSPVIIYTLLFSIGFFAGPQVLTFAISKELSPPRSTGTSAAFNNFLVTIGGFLFAPLVGTLMVHMWHHTYQLNGLPHYSLSTFQNALLVLPLSSIAAVILMFFLPETHCQPRHLPVRRRARPQHNEVMS